MSELKQRLQNASEACITTYEAWNKDRTNDVARGELFDTVHELRKVASRLEIEIALNDRKNTNAKRIPIPEHQSKMGNRRDQKPLSEILPVAEIKEARRRKIEIQRAQEEAEMDDDDIIDGIDGDDDTGNEVELSDDNNNTPKSDKPKRQRTPRRRRPEGKGNNEQNDEGGEE